MCKEYIVQPVGVNVKNKPLSNLVLVAFFKKFWERITFLSTGLDEAKVNMCLSCGDLEINREWQRIPHPQKQIISDAIKSGEISVNGHLVICNFCLSMEKEIKENRKNLYQDRMSICVDLDVVPASSMSF